MQKAKEITPIPDILIVDDTPANLQFLAALFKTKGFQTRAALNGKLALMAIQMRPPDLILMDVHMPDINGIDLCKRIKANPSLTDIPVIFVSGEHEPVNKVKAFASGGVDFITRPFQTDELISRVTTHLNLKKQQEQLRSTMLRMQELEVLRDNLVHMIIHDLRNPLFSIENYLELIIADEAHALTPRATEFIRETQVQTNIMIELINSILDVNRMEAAPIKLNLERCDLGLLCQRVSEAMAPLKHLRSLNFAPPGSPIMVDIDTGLIRRVMTNLITHAIQATRDDDTGRISIGLTAGKDSVRISVCDNGRPIPPQEHPAVFEKYSQADSALTGTGRYAPGLALPFCKLAVAAHGGRIGIQSQAETGNTFWFELPLAV